MTPRTKHAELEQGNTIYKLFKVDFGNNKSNSWIGEA